MLTDINGVQVHHYEYYAFGKDHSPAQPCSFNVSHRYTGQIFDEDTGLYYYNARYYDAELGRFIQPDTIVPDPFAPQTLNRYSYCNNNPLNYIDPSGHVGIVERFFQWVDALVRATFDFLSDLTRLGEHGHQAGVLEA